MKEKEKKQFNRKLLMCFLKGSKRIFALSMLMAAVSALADMLSPQIVRLAVDNVISHNSGSSDPILVKLSSFLGGTDYLRANIWVLALSLIAVALLKAVSIYLFRVSNTAASEKLTKTMRDTLFVHVEHLPFSWHMKHRTGDIIQRCTSDIDTLKGFISEQMTSIFRIVILLAFSIAFMSGMNVPLTLIAMAPVPVILAYSVSFHKKIGAAFLDCDENEGKLSSIAQENLTGVRVVRAFGRERQERDRFFAQNEYYTGLWMKLARPLSMYWSIGDVISGTQILLITVFGSVFCIKDRMLPGEFIAFLSYASMLTWPVRMLGRLIAEMSKAGVSIDRIADIMRSKEEKETGKALKAPMDGDIVFDNVSFSYDNGPEVLKNVSFKVSKGTTVGILGGTGSGKSTLMLLLDKLYELPESNGSITVGGTDIRDIETKHLRENIGMVLQEPYLFSRTIAENIAITREKADMKKIVEASRAACLDETVKAFSKGYETFVGERGVTLSGGQKQRAAIARTLIRDTPILIFDDSLSAVDTETDAKIRASLEKRFGSACVFLISHRITTLSRADNIVVLDKGRVIEQGSHDTLKNAGGLYQKICEIQSGAETEAAV